MTLGLRRVNSYIAVSVPTLIILFIGCFIAIWCVFGLFIRVSVLLLCVLQMHFAISGDLVMVERRANSLAIGYWLFFVLKVSHFRFK